MTERDEAALRRLQQDLDELDWPAPELLARYATDPNRLSEVEKQTVERALASSKLVADELATLRGFDFGALDADRRAVAEAAGRPVLDGGGGEGAGGGLFRWLAWLARPPVWAGAAALLALALWLARSDESPIATPRPDADPTLAERTAPDEPSSRADSAASPVSPTSPEPPSTAPHDLAQADRPPTAPTTHSTSPSTAAPGTTGSADVARPDAPAPEAVAGTTPGSMPSRDTEPETRPELQLAMVMPDYRPAYGSTLADGSGEWIVRGETPDAPRVTVVGPDHVARACSAEPTLLWAVERVPAEGTFFLTLVDEQDEPIVLDRALVRPARAGLQRIDLAELGIALPKGRSLRWSIALRADEASAPASFDFGWLRVEPPDAVAAQRLAATNEATRSAAFAELGCYSEALDAALAARAARPDDPAPHRAVARLAEQAGLEPRLLGE